MVAYPRSDGTHEWRDADAVWLVSNPSTARALEKESDGLLHPREDTALLRVDPPPRSHVTLSDRIVKAGERVWMAGFPIRSARWPSLPGPAQATLDSELNANESP